MLKGAEGGWLIVMDVHPSKRRSHMYLLHGARVNRCSPQLHKMFLKQMSVTFIIRKPGNAHFGIWIR